MYSMVLMAALTVGGESPQLCFCRGCSGFGGCFGGCYGCAGYYACGGYGCWGYGCFASGYGNGCFGYGNGCFGCCHGFLACASAGCYSCAGGYACNGCFGGWGGYGYSWYTCDGCFGCWGSYGYGGHGYGGHGCAGWGALQLGATYAPQHAPSYSAPADAVMPHAHADGKANGVEDNRARLVVELPEDARLFIDDQRMKSTSARRTFNTPVLEKGQTYYYELKVEVAREGVTHSETKKVIVRPGEEVRAAFTEGGILAASRDSRAASKK
jgi:uncharacterized protein (TIGR03000 family)